MAALEDFILLARCAATQNACWWRRCWCLSLKLEARSPLIFPTSLSQTPESDVFPAYSYFKMYSVTATVFLLLSCFGSTVFATCYNPDGTALDGDNAQAFQPCNQIAGVVSQCCGTNWSAVAGSKVENDQCQSNGLCLNSANNAPLYWRSSCTDKTWQSPLCLRNLCTNPNVSIQAPVIKVLPF